MVNLNSKGSQNKGTSTCLSKGPHLYLLNNGISIKFKFSTTPLLANRLIVESIPLLWEISKMLYGCSSLIDWSIQSAKRQVKYFLLSIDCRSRIVSSLRYCWSSQSTKRWVFALRLHICAAPLSSHSSWTVQDGVWLSIKRDSSFAINRKRRAFLEYWVLNAIGQKASDSEGIFDSRHVLALVLSSKSIDIVIASPITIASPPAFCCIARVIRVEYCWCLCQAIRCFCVAAVARCCRRCCSSSVPGNSLFLYWCCCC